MELRRNHYGTDISELQARLRDWREKNFKQGSIDLLVQTLQVLEEAAELARAVQRTIGEEGGIEPDGYAVLVDFVLAGIRAEWFVKTRLGIRGGASSHMAWHNDREPKEAIIDAIADIQIALLGVADLVGISADRNLAEVAEKVLARDWIAYPFDGRTK